MSNEAKDTDMTKAPSAELAVQDNFVADVQRTLAMRKAVHQIIGQVMIEGEHYGVVPGTVVAGQKPRKVLFQPGADVLCMVFRLRPEYEVIIRTETEDFIHFEVRCRLYNIQSGELVGEGIGTANSREDKYLNQCSNKVCPNCQQPTIFKSKKEPGWFCWQAKGGCGATFREEDKAILDQVGVVNGKKVWNLHNTIRKIANKRAKSSAIITVTAASDNFTVDMLPDPEDDEEGGHTSGKGTPVRATENPAATAPHATPVQIRDLNDALVALGIGREVPAEIQGDARKEKVKQAKLGWVNDMLAEHESDPVKGMQELTSELAANLIKAAKAGEMPRRDVDE